MSMLTIMCNNFYIFHSDRDRSSKLESIFTIKFYFRMKAYLQNHMLLNREIIKLFLRKSCVIRFKRLLCLSQTKIEDSTKFSKLFLDVSKKCSRLKSHNMTNFVKIKLSKRREIIFFQSKKGQNFR